jgi:hypothetical protein
LQIGVTQRLSYHSYFKTFQLSLAKGAGELMRLGVGLMLVYGISIINSGGSLFWWQFEKTTYNTLLMSSSP